MSSNLNEVPKLHLNNFEGTVFAVLEGALTNTFLAKTNFEILRKVEKKAAKSVVIDLSDATFLDFEGANELDKLGNMLMKLGSKVAIAGLRPEIAAVLVDLQFEFHNIVFTMEPYEAHQILISSDENL